MFRHLSLLINIKHIQIRKNTGLASQPEKWKIICGVCLERKPVLSRPLSQIEENVKKMLLEIELENSMKSDHEIRHEVDLKRAQEFKKGKISDDDIDKSLGQTAAEYEDSCKMEFTQFIPASRETEADKKNDVKSTDRKLDQHLLYIIRRKVGKDLIWMVPEDEVKTDETLRTAAERILQENYGSKLKTLFLSNIPSGFYKYKYPKQVREKLDFVGEKVFFLKAQYVEGEVQSENDFMWATRNELNEKFPQKYASAVNNFLIDDEPIEI